MSITFYVVSLRFIEALSCTLEPMGLAVSPGSITQVGWMHMQLESFESDAMMLTEGTVEHEVAEVTGRLHT
jgi:hypothetical protein